MTSEACLSRHVCLYIRGLTKTALLDLNLGPAASELLVSRYHDRTASPSFIVSGLS